MAITIDESIIKDYDLDPVLVQKLQEMAEARERNEALTDISTIRECLASDNPHMRLLLVTAVREYEDENGDTHDLWQEIVDMDGDTNPEVRAFFVDKNFNVENYYYDEDSLVRQHIVEAGIIPPQPSPDDLDVNADGYETILALRGQYERMYLKDPDWRVRAAIADKGMEPELLSRDADWRVRAAVAHSGNMLNELVLDPDGRVRAEVVKQGMFLDTIARNRGITDAEKIALIEYKSQHPDEKTPFLRRFIDLKNESKEVQIALAKNGYYLEKLSNSKDPDVLVEIVNQKYNLDKFMTHDSPDVRIAVARLGHEPERMLENEKDPRVLAEIARYNSDEKILSKLANSKDYLVLSALQDKGYPLSAEALDIIENTNVEDYYTSHKFYKNRYLDQTTLPVGFKLPEFDEFALDRIVETGIAGDMKEYIDPELVLEALNSGKATLNIKALKAEEKSDSYKTAELCSALAKNGYNLKDLSEDPRESVRIAVVRFLNSRNPNDRAILDSMLATEKNGAVLAEFASKGYKLDELWANPAAKHNVLVKTELIKQGYAPALVECKNDKTPAVVKAFIERDEKLGNDITGYLKDKQSKEVRVYLAQNGKFPLRYMFDKDEDVRAAAASNGKFLKLFARDKSPVVRAAALKASVEHGGYTDIVDILKNDKAPEVLNALIKTLDKSTDAEIINNLIVRIGDLEGPSRIALAKFMIENGQGERVINSILKKSCDLNKNVVDAELFSAAITMLDKASDISDVSGKKTYGEQIKDYINTILQASYTEEELYRNNKIPENLLQDLNNNNNKLLHISNGVERYSAKKLLKSLEEANPELYTAIINDIENDRVDMKPAELLSSKFSTNRMLSAVMGDAEQRRQLVHDATPEVRHKAIDIAMMRGEADVLKEIFNKSDYSAVECLDNIRAVTGAISKMRLSGQDIPDKVLDVISANAYKITGNDILANLQSPDAIMEFPVRVRNLYKEIAINGRQQDLALLTEQALDADTVKTIIERGNPSVLSRLSENQKNSVKDFKLNLREALAAFGRVEDTPMIIAAVEEMNIPQLKHDIKMRDEALVVNYIQSLSNNYQDALNKADNPFDAKYQHNESVKLEKSFMDTLAQIDAANDGNSARISQALAIAGYTGERQVTRLEHPAVAFEKTMQNVYAGNLDEVTASIADPNTSVDVHKGLIRQGVGMNYYSKDPDLRFDCLNSGYIDMDTRAKVDILNKEIADGVNPFDSKISARDYHYVVKAAEVIAAGMDRPLEEFTNVDIDKVMELKQKQATIENAQNSIAQAKDYGKDGLGEARSEFNDNSLQANDAEYIGKEVENVILNTNFLDATNLDLSEPAVQKDNSRTVNSPDNTSSTSNSSPKKPNKPSGNDEQDR